MSPRGVEAGAEAGPWAAEAAGQQAGGGGHHSGLQARPHTAQGRRRRLAMYICPWVHNVKYEDYFQCWGNVEVWLHGRRGGIGRDGLVVSVLITSSTRTHPGIESRPGSSQGGLSADRSVNTVQRLRWAVSERKYLKLSNWTENSS